MTEPTLLDLGERRILSELIPKFSQSSGDDCEAVEVDQGTILITTDPVPPPAAASIGGDDDPYWAGWLLVTINASDIAASGAQPLGIMVAAEFPREETVARFERFLTGVQESCAAQGFKYSGGNLREAERFSATATAFGWTPRGQSLSRRGGATGDLVVSVGQGGLFWRDALRARRGRPVERGTSRLFRPLAQVRAMTELRRAGLVQAAMDTSDGLVPTLHELAAKNACTISLGTDRLTVPDATDLGIDSRKLWLGWGDWTVIAILSREALEPASAIAQRAGSSLHVIGSLEPGAPSVVIEGQSGVVPAGRLESERFARDSWFSRGVGGYIEDLLLYDLPS